MQVKEAVALAKQHVRELFAEEQIRNLGLEEVEFDDGSSTWSITVGFSRPWDQGGLFAEAAAELAPRKRDYKIVRIADADARVLSVKNREPAI